MGQKTLTVRSDSTSLGMPDDDRAREWLRQVVDEAAASVDGTVVSYGTLRIAPIYEDEVERDMSKAPGWLPTDRVSLEAAYCLKAEAVIEADSF